MKENKNKEALEILNAIKKEAKDIYRNTYEGIPIVHDIFRNLALCLSNCDKSMLE